MDSSSLISVIFCILMVTAASLANAKSHASPKFFNVLAYGAKADGKTDNSKAFLKAWGEACHSKEKKKRIFVPKGTYLVNQVNFIGKYCTGEMGVTIKGTLKAPTDPKIFFTHHWIGFKYVDGLVVNGGGYLDGQGASGWRLNDCDSNPRCRTLPVSVTFDFVTNARVHRLRSINSKATHLNLFACENMTMSSIRISAPEDSPNTDGIRMGRSVNMRILNSNIGTGDDCISILPGTRDLNISNVACGPGHGISIGSLGRNPQEPPLTRVTVRNCSFSKTMNGVRIKTWPKPFVSLAENFVFDDIQMDNVSNPIIIDQHYCPFTYCSGEAQSAVQIKGVTYSNIRGTSSTQQALVLNCSATHPCQDVTLRDINLSYKGRGGRATATCDNVRGKAFGYQHPSGCL